MPSLKIPKWLIATLITVAFLGFLDATYLSAQGLGGLVPPCTTGGCETVTTSVYSRIFGIPVAIPGALYYLAFLVLMILYIDLKKEIFLKSAIGISFAGLGAAIWFTSLQVFVIKAYCPFCLFSAATSTVIFVLSMVAWKKLRSQQSMSQPAV